MYQLDWIKGLKPDPKQAKARAAYKAQWWAAHRERLNIARRERRRLSPEVRAAEKQYRQLRKAAKADALKHKKEQPCPQKNDHAPK